MNRRAFLKAATAYAGSVGLYGCSNPVDPGDGEKRPAEPLKVCLHGDTHVGYEGTETFPPAEAVHGPILRHLCAYKPNIVFNLGDLIHNVATDQWSRFEAMTAELRSWARYYPVFGNHDSGCGGVEGFLACFNGNLPNNGGNQLYYWLRHEGVLFVILDVHNSQTASHTIQREWLRQVLSAHRDAVFRFVLFHIPPWTTAGRGPFPYARIFDPVFQEFSVDIVFNGHVHAYERFEKDGVHYVVSGGAGGFGCDEEVNTAHCLDTNLEAELLLPYRRAAAQTNNFVRLEVTEDRAEVRAFDLEEHEIDRLVVTKEVPTAVRVLVPTSRVAPGATLGRRGSVGGRGVRVGAREC